MLTSDNQFRPHPSVVHTKLSDSEAVLLHLETKRYYSLNETGLRIWELLQNHASPADILAELWKEYAMEEEESKAYVMEFLEELQQDGLIQKGGA